MKVLLVAQNASSRLGGEAFLPLNYFQVLLRRGVAVQLIAHNRNRANLEAVLGPDAAAVHFIPDTRWHRLVWRAGRQLPHRLFGPVVKVVMGVLNDRCQRALIRDLVDRGEVDVIHQPIPVSPRTPSAIYGFGIPVVIGPMNGNMSYPPGYEDYEPAWERRGIAVTRGLARLANRIVPGKRRAAALLVANERTRRALPVDGHPRIIELVENGVDLTVWQAPGGRPAVPGPFRLVFIGRLIALKGLDFTLEALALLRDRGIPVHFDVVGDGPEAKPLRQRVAAMGLADCVTFHGFRPQADCAELLVRSDALVLNSLRECGGAVVLEAMSLGLPVVAADWGGPADYLDESCGLLVSPVPREDFAARLAEAIGRLAADPGLARRMGEAGARKVRSKFDWERKIDRILEIYAEVVAEAGR